MNLLDAFGPDLPDEFANRNSRHFAVARFQIEKGSAGPSRPAELESDVARRRDAFKGWERAAQTCERASARLTRASAKGGHESITFEAALQECSSVGRASVSKTEGRGFESLHSCH